MRSLEKKTQTDQFVLCIERLVNPRSQCLCDTKAVETKLKSVQCWKRIEGEKGVGGKGGRGMRHTQRDRVTQREVYNEPEWQKSERLTQSYILTNLSRL